MNDGIGLAEGLLGPDRFGVLEVGEEPDEFVITMVTRRLRGLPELKRACSVAALQPGEQA